MIMQMPIIQGTILIALNVINIEDPSKFGRSMLFLGPFMIVSILTGVWGLNVTLRMLMTHCAEFKLKGKFLAIQLVLITCKLQPYIVNEVMKSRHIQSTEYPVTPRVTTNSKFRIVVRESGYVDEFVFFSSSHRAAGDHVRGSAAGPVGQRSVQDTDQGNRSDGARCLDTAPLLPTTRLPQIPTNCVISITECVDIMI